MTWANAANEVLKRAREPLKPSEIVQQAVRLNFITKKRQANVQMAASIRQDSRRRFFSIGKGRYGLKEWLKGKKVTIADLAFWIFKSENKLLSYRDIAKQIERVRDLGKTPDIAVHVVLKNGKAFKKFGRGIFGLKSWSLPTRLYGDFKYATPSQFWRMPSRLSKFLSGARQVAKICCPYVDKSTFQTFISRIPKRVETQLIVTKDVQWQNKVKAGLSGDFLAKFASGRRLITRRVDELHSRFIVIDDVSVCLLSADLQTDQQTKRYQYAYFTNDPKITKDAIAYFDDLWTNGEVCDLEAEARVSP
jgi:hypothetical protein